VDDLKQNMLCAYIIRAGFESYASVGNALVKMHATFGSIEDGKHVFFDKMVVQDVISWTAIITDYAKSGHIDYAHHLFDSMYEQ
jgi:pentatricopeptide repeat protein